MTEVPIALQARHLSKSFGDRAVLRCVDLVVTEGQVVAITGVNGAGKTTLLRCLAGLTRSTCGEVRWLGRLASADPAARRLVGMASHESFVYPHLTAPKLCVRRPNV